MDAFPSEGILDRREEERHVCRENPEAEMGCQGMGPKGQKIFNIVNIRYYDREGGSVESF